jgi:hypothetical protein
MKQKTETGKTQIEKRSKKKKIIYKYQEQSRAE